MAFTKQATTAVDEVRPYLHGVAKYLTDSLWGPNGPPWGTTLTELEDVLLAIRHVLTERMLQQVLQRQAADPTQRPPELQHCPGCDGALDADDPEPRLVRTRVGDADWQEPRDFCRRCRRAFFPSVEESGR